MNNISQDDLLKFLYNETTAQQTLLIQQLITTDTGVAQRVEFLKAAKSQLDEVNVFSPSQNSLNRIFNYAEISVEEFHTHK